MHSTDDSSADRDPRVSIVIPTLNSGATLGECLQAIRSQAYSRDKVEIVVADAGSTDDTLKIAESSGATVVSDFAMHAEALLHLGEIDRARPIVERVFALGWHDPYFLDLCRTHGFTYPTKSE